MTTPLPDISHRTVPGPRPGLRIHVATSGPERTDAPLVLLVHGFPESWFSWRYQIPVLARAGYRVAAIDVRGYGRSSAPTAIEDYRMTELVSDNIAVLEALEATGDVVIVGHDWGAPIACTTALLRPDLFRGLGILSVPYAPRTRSHPLEAFARLAGSEEFYMQYFQEPGRAEAEIELDVRSWIGGFYFGAAGGAPTPADGGTMMTVAPGSRMCDRFPPIPATFPDWMPEDDFEFYVAEFERTGLTGGLNKYRNLVRDWQDLAPFTFRPIVVPAIFIGGSEDGPTIWGQRAIDRFPETLPDCRGVHILEGCGHWVQQERAVMVNDLLLGFLADVAPTG